MLFSVKENNIYKIVTQSAQSILGKFDNILFLQLMFLCLMKSERAFPGLQMCF